MKGRSSVGDGVGLRAAGYLRLRLTWLVEEEVEEVNKILIDIKQSLVSC